METKGISGPISFKEGRRIQFKLDLLKLKQHSLVKVINKKKKIYKIIMNID